MEDEIEQGALLEVNINYIGLIGAPLVQTDSECAAPRDIEASTVPLSHFTRWGNVGTESRKSQG